MEEPKTESRAAAFVAGAKAIVPVLLALIPFGVAFGATAIDNGLSTIEAERLRYTTFAQRSEREPDDLTSMHNCIRPEVRFHALLTQDEIQKLDVVRA